MNIVVGHELETVRSDSVAATEELDHISVSTAVHVDVYSRTSLRATSSTDRA